MLKDLAKGLYDVVFCLLPHGNLSVKSPLYTPPGQCSGESHPLAVLERILSVTQSAFCFLLKEAEMDRLGEMPAAWELVSRTGS